MQKDCSIVVADAGVPNAAQYSRSDSSEISGKKSSGESLASSSRLRMDAISPEQ
jgi:hypothetical protein